MNVRFFNPALTYKKLKKPLDAAYKRVMGEGQLILRKDTEDFERDFAAYNGVKYAVALNSGTDALYLALWALGIKPGDEVAVPSHTFVATAQVVAQLGAKPVLYDRGEYPVISDHTKAIMVAHIAGEFALDMGELMRRAGTIPVIEDACQSLGATQWGRKAGATGIAGDFSFYPAKILGCFGDGGALITNDEKLANDVRELRNHWKSDYSRWGINSRLDNLQAAFLNVRLPHLPEMLARRKEIAERYLSKLRVESICLPDNTPGRVWQDFILCVPDRNKLYDFLKERGVETMRNDYPFPIQKGQKALHYESCTLRLPCNENLTNREVNYVIKCINEFFNG